jgi:serine/threonine protein kinase
MDLSAKRILIVDDEKDSGMVMKTMLERAGFGKVDAVHTGLEGITALDAFSASRKSPAYDVVILDVMLPETNGFELCESMRNKWGEDLVLLLVTGFSVEDCHARYVESGADDFLTKPIKRRELISRVRLHLEKRRTVAKTPSTAPHSIWSDLVVDVIDDYAIVKRLSWSGAVVTYEALRGKQRCVVKVLTNQAMEYDDVRARFLRERDLLASFNHPNITRNLGSGTFNGLDYFANEFIEGKSLDEFSRINSRPTMEFIIDVAAQTSGALAYLHSMGVIHRGLKLKNIFVDSDRNVKIGEFEIAMVKGSTRLTQNGFAIGTPLYMAPEQYERGEITTATDMYSFGANMYHLTMGVPPFMAGNAMEILRKHAKEPVRPMSRRGANTSGAWNDLIVDRCMAKDPANRPESMSAVHDEIEAIGQSLAQSV